jgi:lipoprotein-anchoring transpeptidase ErfK/SrfK
VTPYDAPRALRARPRLLLALAGAAVLSAGAVSAVTLGGQAAPVSSARAEAPPPVPTPRLEVVGERDRRVPWDAPLAVTVADGELVSVSVRGPADVEVPGQVADPVTWRATGALVPDAPYDVLALVRDRNGAERWVSGMARTAPAVRTVKAALSPGDGAVVGVGMPVVVRLDAPVQDPAARAALVERLQVTSTPAVDGAWRWIAADQLHYRPERFWEPGTRISVVADLRRLPLPGGVWGDGVRTTDYTVGDAITSTVDVGAKTMTVRRDGQVLRVLKASMGRPEFPTRDGVHLVLEKEAAKTMDSSTVGLPGAYMTDVQWAVRLTYSGTFTHSAPWSVKDQGVRNVSHGCINLSPADAKWFFDLAKRGDVVEVVGSGVGPKLSDPGAVDWNMSFEEWKRG